MLCGIIYEDILKIKRGVGRYLREALQSRYSRIQKCKRDGGVTPLSSKDKVSEGKELPMKPYLCMYKNQLVQVIGNLPHVLRTQGPA